MKTTMQPLILSLKPYYADLVFEELKTAELRRRIASHIENRDVFVYVSSPTMALRGGFRVGNLWSGTPEKIWTMVKDIAQVKKPDFDSYFAGQNIAYAFEIKAVWESQNFVSLNELRDKIPNFVVPQSWRYVRDDELKFFEEIRSLTIENSECPANDTQQMDTEHVNQNYPLQSHYMT